MKALFVFGMFAFISLSGSQALAQGNVAKSSCPVAADLRNWEDIVKRNYQSTNQEERKRAVDAAKKYVEHSGECGGDDDFTPWLKKRLPEWEDSTETISAPTYDPSLAKKLGADERGMKMYVLCILKTGPKDAEIKGKSVTISSRGTLRSHEPGRAGKTGSRRTVWQKRPDISRAVYF